MISDQRGLVHLVLLLLVLLVVLGGAIYFVFRDRISLPFQTTKAQVSIQSGYKNPFAKETQYVNPFDQYKSPFLGLKK